MRCICSTLGISKSNFQPEALLKLSELRAHYQFINSISGLEKAINLINLDLSYNPCNNISPLHSLKKLKDINLSSCDLRDIDALSNSLQLEKLDLHDNSIFNVKSLSSLVNLQYLDLSENIITDLSPLQSLQNLQTLHMGRYTDNPIGSHTAEMYGNPYWEVISDIAPLGFLAHIRKLTISDHGIKSISALEKLSELEYLFLGGTCNISCLEDLSALSHLPRLKYINLESNHIIDLQSLVDNPNFGENAELYLDGNPLSSHAKEQQIPLLKKRGVKVVFKNRYLLK